MNLKKLPLLLIFASTAFAANKKTLKKPAAPAHKKIETAAPKAPEPKSSLSEYTLVTELCTVTLRLSNSLMGRFDVIGRGALTGKLELDEGTKALKATNFSFKADSLDSGVGLRDSHIKSRYLETSRFPLILMDSATTELTESSNGVPMKGSLTVKGKTAPISGTSKVRLQDETLRGTVEFNGKIADYPIDSPRYMGVGVKDEFTVIVDLVARPDLQEEGAAESGL